jgi:L-iditol 2-dehydrogenase
VKAAVLVSINDIRFTDVAEPALEPGDIMLRVKAATICGTDIRILRGQKTAGIRYPSVLGHEFAAEIVDNGGHPAFACGEAVAVCPQFACGHCAYCKRGVENLCRHLQAMGYGLDGAFADYVRIPAHAVRSGHLFKMPKELGFDIASLAEPLACVMNGQDLVDIRAGDAVLILGAGPIGLLHVILARLSGAATIIVSDPNPLRREAALRAGADRAIDPLGEEVTAIVKAATEGLGVDVAIGAIGLPQLANDAIRLVRHRGRVSLFAGYSTGVKAEIDVNDIHYREILVTGSFGLTRRHFERALTMLSRHREIFQSIITHRFSLSDIGGALSMAENGRALKVALSPM